MYKPTKQVAEILEWCLNAVKSVSYSVTLRWVFYRAVQELGLTKKDYRRLKAWTSKARKNFWNGWAPWTIIDDTREIHYAGDGYESFKDWVNSFKTWTPTYAAYPTQDKIVQVWFEARAMYSQFAHYVSPLRIPLIPFKGDTSINHKWRIAEYLASLYAKYQKPMVALYFGDYEPFKDRGSRAKGITIPLSALKDIKQYLARLLVKKGFFKDMRASEVAEAINKILTFERVGLNQEHITRWGLPENPERPGEYQWEALSDDQARELILGSIQKHWNIDAIKELEKRENEDASKWQEIIEKVVAGGI